MKDININYFADTAILASTATNPATVVPSTVRVMLICDKECNQALPSVNQILATVSPHSFLNKDYSDRFTVIRDIRIGLSPYANANSVGKIYLKLPIHIYYDGSGTAITNAKENQLFLLTITDLSTPSPQFGFAARFNFYDN